MKIKNNICVGPEALTAVSCSTVCTGVSLLTFRRSLLPPSSGRLIVLMMDAASSYKMNKKQNYKQIDFKIQATVSLVQAVNSSVYLNSILAKDNETIRKELGITDTNTVTED